MEEAAMKVDERLERPTVVRSESIAGAGIVRPVRARIEEDTSDARGARRPRFDEYPRDRGRLSEAELFEAYRRAGR